MLKLTRRLLWCFLLISNHLACWSIAHALEHHPAREGQNSTRRVLPPPPAGHSNKHKNDAGYESQQSQGGPQTVRKQLGVRKRSSFSPPGLIHSSFVSSKHPAGRQEKEQEEDDLALDLDSLDSNDQLAAWLPGASNWQQPVQPFVWQRRLYLPGQYPETHTLSTLLPGSKTRHPVPKIFHQIFLDGEAGLEEALSKTEVSNERWPTVKRSWRESCQALHPSWEFQIWNASAMQSLIADRYPWFLATYRSYPRDIHRVDAIRPFILDAFGGVYMDLDVECFRPVDAFLQGHELVLQEEDMGRTSLVNSAIAGAQGLYFWQVWQKVLYTRAPQLQRVAGFRDRHDQDVIAVLNTTGPWALRAAFQEFNRNSSLLRKNYVGAWNVNGTDLMVYPAGSWFVPCFWNDWRCHRTVEKAIRSEETMPVWLAGHHKNSGSWFKTVGYSRDTNFLVRLLKDPAVIVVFLAVFMYFLQRFWRPGSVRGFSARLD